jgi:hypothetical protein
MDPPTFFTVATVLHLTDLAVCAGAAACSILWFEVFRVVRRRRLPTFGDVALKRIVHP